MVSTKTFNDMGLLALRGTLYEHKSFQRASHVQVKNLHIIHYSMEGEQVLAMMERLVFHTATKGD